MAAKACMPPRGACARDGSPYSPRRFPAQAAGGMVLAKGDIRRVVLAYSGGLDTSVILKWLQTTYDCEVVTFTADLGQGEELEPAREKALLLGIKPENIFIEDLREEFVRDYVFPMFRANALYEGQDRSTSPRKSARMQFRTAPPARAMTRFATNSPTTP
jgi:NH3-dependent NAD+ synthetase